MSSVVYEFFWCIYYMISMVVSHSHTNCPQSSNPSQQAHTPWPAWVVEPLSTLSWFGPEPLPCMPAGICALAPLDSPSHSTLRDLAIRLSFTFRQQLNSSCANTFTLNRACINDFMLESLCGSGSGILRRCSGCCSGGGLMGRSADVGWLFQGRTLVGSDGVEPAGLGWTSGSV